MNLLNLPLLIICKAISSTSIFKACGPDGIPMEFFKALIPCKDDSEGSSDNNNNISSDFKCLKALINRIWNGDFPKSWNNTSIISIHKKVDQYQIIITIVAFLLSIIG